MNSESKHPAKRAAGCVVYRHDTRNVPLILLIHDQYSNWTLPKGYVEPHESEEAAAVREVLEETGIVGELGPKVDEITYVVTVKGVPFDKRVTFFLLRATTTITTPQADEGIRAVRWFMTDEALALIGYSNVRDVLHAALRMIMT